MGTFRGSEQTLHLQRTVVCTYLLKDQVGLGYIDDVLLLPGLIWLAIRLTPSPILAECRQQGEEWMAREGVKPRSRWGIALVVGV